MWSIYSPNRWKAASVSAAGRWGGGFQRSRGGLAVTGQGFDAENPPDISRSCAFAPHKLGDTVHPAAISEILGRCRVHGMKIGVVTDVVLSQRQNHVAPTALLEDARLFTDQLE